MIIKYMLLTIVLLMPEMMTTNMIIALRTNKNNSSNINKNINNSNRTISNTETKQTKRKKKKEEKGEKTTCKGETALP